MYTFAENRPEYVISSQGIQMPAMQNFGPNMIPYVGAGAEDMRANVSGQPLERQDINVMLGNQTIETITVTGIRLMAARGVTMRDLGLR